MSNTENPETIVEDIAKHQEAIIDYFNTLMEEKLEPYLEYCEFDQLGEEEKMNLSSNCFISDFINEENINHLKQLGMAVNSLKSPMQYEDQEEADMLKDINQSIRKILMIHNRINVSFEKGTSDKSHVEIKSTSLSTLTIEECLQFYVSTFVTSVEDAFIEAARYLNGEEIDVTNLNSTILNVTEFCSHVPSLETVGLLTKQIAVFFRKRGIKELAATFPPSIIQSFAQKEYRRILIEGAYKVFSHYEYQFSLIKWRRYAEKLATDSAHRLIAYVWDKSEIKIDDVIKGILHGKSTINPNRLFRRGRTLVINKKDVVVDEFFSKTGIRRHLGDQIVYYLPEDAIDDLKYRLEFPWDDFTNYHVVHYDDPYKYRYTNDKEKDEIRAIWQYMNSDSKCCDLDGCK